ncbi:hypothetical protein, partial [Pseudomonas coronafaciens]|uniref:hypothetical protein n=1 Tax=Pseudomonas coronafaciens TaxID=53409 RepID=UPI001C821C7B
YSRCAGSLPRMQQKSSGSPAAAGMPSLVELIQKRGVGQIAVKWRVTGVAGVAAHLKLLKIKAKVIVTLSWEFLGI